MGVKMLFAQGQAPLNCLSVTKRHGKKEDVTNCASIVGTLLTKMDFFVMLKKVKKYL